MPQSKTFWILIILVGLLGFRYLNCNSLMIWNSNQITVNVESELSKADVKIEHGISVNTINRSSDLDLFVDRKKYDVVFNGRQNGKIKNEYGENDFLVTYNNEYYLSFRQFKRNRRHQHKYTFNFGSTKSSPIVSVEIVGRDGMKFKREMIKIDSAKNYICNTPIEDARTIYNMIELTKE